MDAELVDLAGVQERGDQFSAAHHPDVLARRLPQTPRERLHRLGHEIHAGRRPPGRLPGKDVIREPRVEIAVLLSCLPPKVEGPIVGLAPHQDRVDRRGELPHAVVGGAGTAIEPFHIAVGPGDEPVGARCDGDDDLSFPAHRCSASRRQGAAAKPRVRARTTTASNRGCPLPSARRQATPRSGRSRASDRRLEAFDRAGCDNSSQDRPACGRPSHGSPHQRPAHGGPSNRLAGNGLAGDGSAYRLACNGLADDGSAYRLACNGLADDGPAYRPAGESLAGDGSAYGSAREGLAGHGSAYGPACNGLAGDSSPDRPAYEGLASNGSPHSSPGNRFPDPRRHAVLLSTTSYRTREWREDTFGRVAHKLPIGADTRNITAGTWSA